MLTPYARKVLQAILVSRGAGGARNPRDVFRPELGGDEVEARLNLIGSWVESSSRAGYPGSRGGLARVIVWSLADLLNDRSEAALVRLEDTLVTMAWS